MVICCGPSWLRQESNEIEMQPSSHLRAEPVDDCVEVEEAMRREIGVLEI